MPTGIETRLARLEQSVGVGGGPCPHPAFVVRSAEGEIFGQPICPISGLERTVYQVRFDGEEHDGI